MNKLRIRAVALAALLVACLLPGMGNVAYATSGAIRASEITGSTLELTGQTVLTMDQDLTLTSIQGDSYPLWIDGAGKLTVNNPNGDAISVGALFSREGVDIDATSGTGCAIATNTGDMEIEGDVKASGVWGVKSATEVNVTGNLTATATSGMAVSAQADGITITGDLTATSESNTAVYARYGNCKVGGDVTASSGNDIAVNIMTGGCEIGGDAKVSGTDGFQVSGTDPFNAVTGLVVGGNVTATAIAGSGSGSAIYVSTGPISITGNVEAIGVSTSTDGLAGIFAADGDITIGGNATASGRTFGIYGANIQIDGNVEASTHADSGVDGIRSYKGDVTVGGDATVSGSSTAIHVVAGDCTFGKSVTATSSSAAAIFVENGNCKIEGDVTATGADGIRLKGSQNSLYVGGNATATGLATTTSNDIRRASIYTNGPVTIDGNATATGNAYGICSEHGVTIGGDANCSTLPSGTSGIQTYDGDVEIGGTATVAGGIYGIYGRSVKIVSDADCRADMANGVGGIYATGGNVEVGGNAYVEGRHYGISVSKGDCSTGGDLTAKATTVAAVYMGDGNCSILGNADVTGGDGIRIKGTGRNLYVKGDVHAQGLGENSGGASGSGIYVSGAVKIDGNVEAFSTNDGAAGYSGINAGSTVEIGGNATVKGKTYGIFGGSGVTIAGDADASSDPTGVSGIHTNEGGVEIGGNATLRGNVYGVYAGKSDIKVDGTVDAATNGSSGVGAVYAAAGAVTIGKGCTAVGRIYGIYGIGGVDVTGDVTATSEEDAAIFTPGSCTITGSVKATSIKGIGISVGGGACTITGNAEVSGSDGISGAPEGITIGGNVVAKGAEGKGSGSGIYAQGPVKIKGDVEAYGREDGTKGYCAIHSSNGDVEIDGNATVKGNSFGIYASKGDIKIGGNADAAAISTSGIHANSGSVEIGGDATATGNTFGIYAYGGNVKVSGTVDAAASEGSVAGVYAGDDGTVELGKGGKATGGSFGVYGDKGVTITGDIEATGTSSGGFGIYAYDPDSPITITGNVKATGGVAGIYASQTGSNVTIEGNVEAHSTGTAGIYAGGNLRVTGSVKVDGATFGTYAKGVTEVTGDIEATAGNETNGTAAIYSDGGMQLDGTVTAINKYENGFFCIYTGTSDSKMVFNGPVTTSSANIAINAGGSLEAYDTVTVPGATDAGIHASYGADFYGDIDVTGGRFGVRDSSGGIRFHDVTAKVAATGEDGLYGIYSTADIECDGDITANGPTYGILIAATEEGEPGNVIVQAGRLEANGNDMGICLQKPIEIDPHLGIVEPAGGKSITTTVEVGEETLEVYSIGLEDNAPATHVVITETTAFVTRIAGDYANETSALISAAAFPKGSEWVVIARDDDFADALGATGLAGALGCPIVLTNREELSEAAAAEITRLGAKHACIIGGTGAIKTDVDAGIAALGVTVEPRIWGENSYDTSLECAKRIVELGGDASSPVIAMSMNFQDALSVSPIAYKNKLPVILQTWGDTSAERGFTDEAKQFLAGSTPLIVGGPGAIADASFDGVALGGEPQRIFGETGYDTSNEIAEWAVSEGILGARSVVVACGAQAPKGSDALAGSALAGKLACPILLVNSNEAMEAANYTTIDGFLTAHRNTIRDAYVLGGTYVVPEALYEQIEKVLAEAPIRQ